MKEKLSFKDRHAKVDAELIELSAKVWETHPVSVTATRIGLLFDITGPTVINHCNGEGKDGYLKDAILEELKRYQKQGASLVK